MVVYEHKCVKSIANEILKSYNAADYKINSITNQMELHVTMAQMKWNIGYNTGEVTSPRTLMLNTMDNTFLITSNITNHSNFPYIYKNKLQLIFNTKYTSLSCWVLTLYILNLEYNLYCNKVKKDVVH
jgi:hypothetical protein